MLRQRVDVTRRRYRVAPPEGEGEVKGASGGGVSLGRSNAIAAAFLGRWIRSARNACWGAHDLHADEPATTTTSTPGALAPREVTVVEVPTPKL